MPVYCVALGCSNSTDDRLLSFFRFPMKNARLAKIWEQRLKRPNYRPTENSRLCSDHFEESCFYYQPFTNRRQLRAGSVPTKFPVVSNKPPRHDRRTSFQNSEKQLTSSVQIKQVKPKDLAPAPKKLPVIKMTKASASSYALHKSLKRSSTTNRPIITAVKAEAAINSEKTEVQDTEEKVEIKIEPETDSCDTLFPSSENVSNISSTNMEEKKKIITRENHIVKKRSSSVGSNSSSGSAETTRSSVSSPKKRKIEKPPPPTVVGRQNDCYCWVCHKENIVLCCISCPRAYHFKCAGQSVECDDWICPECCRILKAENVDNLSPVLSRISLDQFCTLLKLSLNKIKYRAPAAFHQPVPIEYYPAYPDYVINPMDLSQIEKNIKQKLYGCTESFLADIKWILHNSCVFNGTQHPLSANAKSLVKTCEYDMGEIEVCPDCFLHACVRNKYWFSDVCQRPHSLVWAKLKGFPYWPAKVVRIVDGNVDARFFGAHDRAWVSVSQCYHLSKEMPTSSKPKKKGTYETALDELNVHVHLLMQRFGTFEYADYRTPFDPGNKFLCYHGIDIDKVVKMENTSSYNAANLCSRDFHSVSNMDIKQEEEEISETGCNQANGIFVQKESSINDMLSTVNSSSGAQPLMKSSQLSSENIDNTKLNAEKKAPPVGVFEVSSAVQYEIPPNLKIDSKALSTKPVVPVVRKDQKIASALERIKEIISSDDVKSEGENKTVSEAVKEQQLLHSDDEGEASIKISSDSKLGENKSHSQVEKSDDACCLNEEQNSNVNIIDTKEQTPVLSSKKSDLFALKLDETIESCKAKLGITEIVEDESSDESCDDEAERDDESSSETDDDGDEDQSSGAEEDSRTESFDTDIEELDDGAGSSGHPDESVGENSECKMEDRSSEPDESVGENSECKMEDRSSEPDESVGENSECKVEDRSSEPDESIEGNSECKAEDRSSEACVQSEEVVEISAGSKECVAEVEEINEKETLPAESGDVGAISKVDLGEKENIGDTDVIPEKQSESCTVKMPDEKNPSLPETHSSSLTPANDNLEILSSPANCQEKGGSDNNLDSVHSSPELKIISVSGNYNHIADVESPVKGSSTSNVNASFDEKSSVHADREPAAPDKRIPDNMIEVADKLQLEIDGIKQRLAMLKKEYEKQQWFHAQENAELQHNLNLIVMEMRASLEADKRDALQSLQKQQEVERHKCIEETKNKQWCANCHHEAVFLCCWNTSYCSHFCQKHHWPKHMHHCRQLKPSAQAFNSELSKVTNAKLETGEVTDGHALDKKVIFVNVKSSDLLSSGIVSQTLSPNVSSAQVLDTSSVSQPLLTKPQIQLVTSKPPLQFISPSSLKGATPSSSHFQLVPTSSVQILTPLKSPNEIGTKPLNSVNPVFKNSSDIITKVRSRQTNLKTAIAVLNEMNKETAATTLPKKDKDKPTKAEESEAEDEIHFKIPDNNVDEVLAAEDEDNDEENDVISDDDDLSGSMSTEEGSPEDEQAVLNDCTNDKDSDDMVSIADGIEIKAKSLNRCLTVGKTPAKLTRLLMSLLFPDISLLARSCVFGRRSNFTKKTRPALPTNLVQAIIEYVKKIFPDTPRSEIVLVMNLKCKEARRTLIKSQERNSSGGRMAKRKTTDEDSVPQLSAVDQLHEESSYSSPKRPASVASMLKARLSKQPSTESCPSSTPVVSLALRISDTDSPLSQKSAECPRHDIQLSPAVNTKCVTTSQSSPNIVQQVTSVGSSPSSSVDDGSVNESSQSKKNKPLLPNSVVSHPVSVGNSSLPSNTSSLVMPNSNAHLVPSVNHTSVNSFVMASPYSPLEINSPRPLIIYRNALSTAFQFGTPGSSQVELSAPNSTSSPSSACLLTSPQLHSLLTKKDS